VKLKIYNKFTSFTKYNFLPILSTTAFFQATKKNGTSP